MIQLAASPIDPAELLNQFAAHSRAAGAIVSFSGLVRPDHQGEPVQSLWLDHHESLTVAALDDIADRARRQFGVIDIAIIHRIGTVLAGQPIVFVAAAAEHRRAAFDAVDYVMDCLKTDAPFWKCETRGGAQHWIEARAEDHSDLARWEPGS